MTTDQIVPESTDFTRDMGVVEANSPARPPYAELAEMVERLRPLVDEFGAGVVLQAAQRIADQDPVEQARIEADVRQVRKLAATRALGGSPLLAELFPTQPTAATAA